MVDAAKRNAEVIRPLVSAWLQKVDDLNKQMDGVLKGAAISEMQCLFLRCPNLKTRYLLGRKATKKTVVTVKLQVEGTFERVGYPTPPVLMPNQSSHQDFYGFETRITTKKEILEALKDKDINIIGICGMPGVGKTTMANEVATQVKDEKLFDEVAMAIVSHDPDIIKIQDQLAEKLHLKIEEKTESGRAQRLYARLTYDNKRILLILDDVWKEIDLGTIGIPSKDDCKGLKVLFTTRNEDVCIDMGVQRKFEVEVLSQEEAHKLFEHSADISNYTINVVNSTAHEVANECGGLPLALVTVGKALKNKMPHKWRDALQQLQRSRVTNLRGMHDLVYSRIELSYNYLETDEARSLLLLCSLFAEKQSITIERLVRYARGLELFQNTDTLSETRDRVYSIVDDLKRCYLLLSGEEEEVKLHDVVRGFCLLDKPGYLVKHADLGEWPRDNEESYIAISMTFGVLDELPSGLKYGHLKLLRVRCDSGEQNISEEFFKDMLELRVLEFNWMNIQIPSSIQLLTSLQTLSLDYCDLMFDISMIGSLKKLEILTFYHSYLYVDFPTKIAQLSNLKLLDLRFWTGPRPLPPGVLLGMKKLEELYFGEYFETRDEEKGYIIEEISSLTALNTFQISTDDTQFLMQILQVLCVENLKRYEITIAEKKGLGTGDYHVTRRLDLLDGIEAGTLLQCGCNSLMRTAYQLYIVKAIAWKKLVSGSDKDGFFNLKKLRLSSGDFEYIIDATYSIPSGTFCNLELLKLEGLHNLIQICNGNLPRTEHFGSQSFHNLTILEIYNCDAIRSLFRESVAKCMMNLQRLDISICPMLEEVVSMDVQENLVTEMLGFPKLKKVTLQSLSIFKSFTSESNKVDDCQSLFNQVTLPNMEMLDIFQLDCIVKLLGEEEMPITSLSNIRVITVGSCGNLWTIAQSDSIKLLQNLEGIVVSDCAKVEVLFDLEGLKVNKYDAEICILGRLNSLEMSTLPKLMHITRMVPKGICVFQNLKSLVVKECGGLRYLFSRSMVSSLVALETIRVQSCDAMEAIVGSEGETWELEKLELPKLKDVNLEHLSSFKSFRSKLDSMHVLGTLFNQVRLANLEVLDIDGLGDVSVLFDFEGVTASEGHVESLLGRLITLKIERLPKLVNITRMVPEGIHVMQNLTSLVVVDCSSLRYLFSPSMANLLVALETLEVYECQEMEEIVGREKEGTSDIDMVEEGMTRRIVFPKLSSLELLSLDGFRMFCSQNYELVFPSLHKLVILYCPVMTKFCSGHLNAPELKQIQIGEGQYVDISNFIDDSGLLEEEE
ncbi:unnamed protein product [Fraxinus pennsylvanica]|uniref:AAA+ ATPase domain-containing protein n=1 Tax=Fraxinus pennsylvanica TaxID=56036 RepID=A0AAD2A1H7_9LAMI|nr:unnamed protein product [Fraxinus pennsylvanica]